VKSGIIKIRGSLGLLRLKCDEAPEEEPTVTVDKVLKIECNISITTNYMASGIADVRA
jgi:ubiquitin carboxyl-terminal hydrolase 14